MLHGLLKLYGLYSNYAENVPIIFKLLLMISLTYYVQKYASIIHPSLLLRQFGKVLTVKISIETQDIIINGSVIILNNGGSVEIMNVSSLLLTRQCLPKSMQLSKPSRRHGSHDQPLPLCSSLAPSESLLVHATSILICHFLPMHYSRCGHLPHPHVATSQNLWKF